MKTFMLLCFLLLGLTFYEMSGGSDFAPQEQVVADVAVTPDTSPGQQATALIAISSSSIEDRLAAALITPAVANAPLEPAVIEAAVIGDPAVEAVEAVAEVIAIIEPEQPAIDLRRVGSSRVNMRDGPGTNFPVLVTLNSGTTAEILGQNDDGWVRVKLRDTGQEGWIAARLLEPVNG